MRDAMKHMEAAMQEMEDRLNNGNGDEAEHERDSVFIEMQQKMRALVEKMNLLAGRMSVR